MVNRLSINADILSRYIEESKISLDFLKEKIIDIDKFLVGDKLPTYNQLEKISNIINVPVGLLTLQHKVNINTQRLSFRTHNSNTIDEMSAELRDTIIEMQEKQSFLQEQIDETIDLSTSQLIQSKDHMTIAEAVRNKLQISVNHLPESRKNPINYFREKTSNIGVFVFFNGKIQDNTHRPLNPKEFRGFSLKSTKAPIIFVNQKDSPNAQLFTLVHELTHLFVDDEGISHEDEQYDFDHIQNEALINQVTAEILVPKILFERETSLDIEELSSKYRVSRYVIARRLFDLNKIGKIEYDRLTKELKSDNFKRKKADGGNYNNNIKFRIDATFYKFVHNAIMQDQVSYSEAFRLIGIGYKGFKTLERELM
jgi:Zn-dependent peptidase ImmA (M78 family)